MYVVGNRGAGKTTLLNRYLYPSKVGRRRGAERSAPGGEHRTFACPARLLPPLCAASDMHLKASWRVSTPHQACMDSIYQPCCTQPSQAEAPKPSEGLEYVFARRPGTFDLEHKDTAHIWELGGGEAFMERVLASDQLFLNYRQVCAFD